MAATICYIGQTFPVDFQVKWPDGTSPSLTGAKLWGVINPKKTPTQSPPTAVRGNAATGAGGSDTDVPTISASEGKFACFFRAADTELLTDGTEYLAAGWVELTDGRKYPAGVMEFTASGFPPRA
jgi:type II secretory pathway pseudopilin PulG